MSNNKFYEARRYSDGFATAANTRYTVTFRQYPFLPIKKKGKTVIFDTETNLNFDEDKLQISFQKINNKEKIFFRDNSGHIYSKAV